jgi:hypothetical protein
MVGSASKNRLLKQRLAREHHRSLNLPRQEPVLLLESYIMFHHMVGQHGFLPAFVIFPMTSSFVSI